LNGFLFTVPEFQKRIAEILLDFIDRVNIAVTIAARSSSPKALHEVSKPSVPSLLILATVARNGEYRSLGRERLTKCIDN
jgi:hypothetical protein